MGEEVVSSSVFGKRMRVSDRTIRHGTAWLSFLGLDQIASRTVRWHGIWELIRTQMGVVLGMIVNFAFGALRFLN
jgi:hypothetical protein